MGLFKACYSKSAVDYSMDEEKDRLIVSALEDTHGECMHAISIDLERHNIFDSMGKVR